MGRFDVNVRFKKSNGKNEGLSYVSWSGPYPSKKKAECYIGYFDPQFDDITVHSYKKPALLIVFTTQPYKYEYYIEDICYETKKDWEETKEFLLSLK